MFPKVLNFACDLLEFIEISLSDKIGIKYLNLEKSSPSAVKVKKRQNKNMKIFFNKYDNEIFLLNDYLKIYFLKRDAN